MNRAWIKTAAHAVLLAAPTLTALVFRFPLWKSDWLKRPALQRTSMPSGQQTPNAIPPIGRVAAGPSSNIVSVRSSGFRRVVRKACIAQQMNEVPLEQKRSTGMKTTLMVCAVAAGLVSPDGNTAANDAKATQLAGKYNCQVCHALDKKLVGPAYKDIAKKYAADKSAAEKLEHKVKNGGSGVWGAIPMPPNNVPDADIKTMVEWVLSLN